MISNKNTVSGLLIAPLMNQRCLDGTIVYSAKASWKEAANVSATVSVTGYSSFDEACVAAIEKAKQLGFEPDR